MKEKDMRASLTELSAAEIRFAESARRVFDESVAAIDGATLSKLNKGRHVALASQGHHWQPGFWRYMVPVGGTAAAVLIAVLMMRIPDEQIMPATATATDFEILLDDDNLEMLEDLDFYNWMDTADLNAGNGIG